MFEFGRELKRVLGLEPAHGEPDLSLLELMDASMLGAQGKTNDTDAGRVSAKDPFALWLRSAAIWREHARRTGDALALRKAASAATSADRAATTPTEHARADLEQALASLTGADLFGDPELLDAAREGVRQVSRVTGDPVLDVKVEVAHARIASRDALATDDYARALDAAALFDCAIHRLDSLALDRKCTSLRYEASMTRIERADLLTGFGLRLSDTNLLTRVEVNLTALLKTIDPDYEPLAWARAAEVLGAAQAGLGDLDGRPERIAQGVSTLATGTERFTCDHSPLDWARLQHGLGVGLQALGEGLDNHAAFTEAEFAFDRAVEVVGRTSLAMRSTVANNRAACLARRAECYGDGGALNRAEAAFKAEAANADPLLDPVAWAVLQVNLARVYESRAELDGDFANREAAVYALEGALDVFCDHGLKRLADTATAALERVRAA
jgi:hypothetical protein